MKSKKLNISILSSGRFHLLDLARELSEIGHEVSFYSYVPKRRTQKFGLPQNSHRALLPYVFPLVLWQRLLPKLFPLLRERILYKALNYLVISKLKPCDLIIGMSGIYLEALEYAKINFDAQINLHRGSKHILVQDKILSQLPNAERPSRYIISRELKGYDLADYILVPSQHAFESFNIDPQCFSKCIAIPYGVDLKSFPLKQKNAVIEQPKGLFVGLWSFQKGCDLIAEVVSHKKYFLQHVGDIGDLPFEQTQNLIHHNKVDQNDLSIFYHTADYFVLASRQDGFGMVLTQALASGIPVLTTYDTGGSDLQITPALKDNIILVNSNDLNALSKGFELITSRLTGGKPFIPITEVDREALSWKGYGIRYDEFLQQI